MDSRRFYEPTQEEIKRKCAEIQKGWTERDRRLWTATAYQNPPAELQTYDYLEAHGNSVSHGRRRNWRD